MNTLSVGFLLRHSANRLKEHSSTPQLDVQLLLAHVLGCTRGQLLATDPTHELTDEQGRSFSRLFAQRMAGVNVAYLLKEKEFYGRLFYVDFGVLVPRPDSEILIEALIEYAQQHTIKTLRDVGTGTGALALTLACELKLHRVVASDVSEESKRVFKTNKEFFASQLNGCVDFVQCSLLSDSQDSYDVIVANLPYLTPEETSVRVDKENWHEPALALDGGEEDGLQLIRKLVKQAAGRCKAIFLEASPEQMRTITKALEEAGFSNIACFRDLSGQERIIAGYII